MSSNGMKMTAAKAAQSNPSSMSSSTHSILLDKLNGRRSTPDSEVLASSDDEGDRQDHQQTTTTHQKPTRRASWLNDTTPTMLQPRKNSIVSNMSPTTSLPSTPSGDSNNWNGATANAHPQNGTSAGRGSSTTIPWGNGIWNNDRKDPPSRLTEVLSSPTSMYPPGGSGYFPGEANINPRDLSANSNIPFAIPLHPTPKTYRSQSYSVGQLESESNVTASSNSATTYSGRCRPLQHSGLQHRPSRPSMLSEMSSEGGLRKVKEVEDDDDKSTNGSSQGAMLQSAEARTIEHLARENAMLRQQQQYQASRIRPRSATSNVFSSSSGYGLHASVPEESEYAVDELDEVSEVHDLAPRGPQARRMSEFGLGEPRLPPYMSLENRKLENVKKAYWQSSNGLERLSDMPQSRRHSFADVPTRHGSISSATGEKLSAREVLQDQVEYQNRYQEPNVYDHGELAQLSATSRRLSLYQQQNVQRLEENRVSPYSQEQFSAASYFGNPLQARIPEAYGNVHPQSDYVGYGIGQFSQRLPSPHRSLYGSPQPRPNQLLYMVTFKCSRADVFYIQEGTGLSVKPGDLVIVEADRGTDLGTVAKANIEWSNAKELKERYAEEHYKWLMMYSQGAIGTADGTGAGLMATSNSLQGSAVGGMGPPTQHGMQEPNAGEIKPKIIKRLAQAHEIQALRDKEGNEAKAKRVCMQKVKEHGLHMEILDAEFQMDWKKLTFYYFADAYINFNSLVTDLFKVYKTRIWMSAINPASFASPSLGLQAPSGIGPGAVIAPGSRTSQVERRPQQEQPSFLVPQVAQHLPNAYTQAFSPLVDRGAMPHAGFQQPGFSYGYSPFSSAPRNVGVSPGGGYGPMLDTGYGSGFATPTDYTRAHDNRLTSLHASTPNIEGDYRSSAIGSPNDNWIGALQGLSVTR
ncbi:hypothetical protein BJ878DRAFT_538602 [Calycina marina]|uniref:PSP1 C-terminal domain-containing protein n=1 Tax=Calycina marina TaxID=1763456 RepID=A0A9P7ZAM0_9HELO|nr:hypothetical protein BJ878DRAFT_538602 [Calycina marina]